MQNLTTSGTTPLLSLKVVWLDARENGGECPIFWSSAWSCDVVLCCFTRLLAGAYTDEMNILV
jgi:hypothetical protein